MANEKETPKSSSLADRRQKWAQLTAKYLRNLIEELSRIKAATQTGDYATVQADAHRIKGTSGTYRLDSLSEIAARIEHLADSQNTEAILSAIDEMICLIEKEVVRLELEAPVWPMGQKEIKMSDYIPHILAVDDDQYLLDIIEHHVSEWGYAYNGVVNSAEMWEELKKFTPSVILLDVKLCDEDGTVVLSELKEQFSYIPVIMITANATVDIAVSSIKNGAYDFVCKPLDFERLRIEIDKATERNRLSLQVKAFQSTALHTDFHGIIGRSEPMRQVYRLIETVAPIDVAVLILGETGTGKELVARAIHQCSKYSSGPFVAVNAPAIPHELIEGALFGHEKGAFTGAHQQHIGFCEQADGGTLFLDEICEMDYNVQAKLLRFLQDHNIQKVGAKSGQTVDVRVIAATNCEPNLQMQNNKLREDFYYRLSQITIDLVPLRQRAGDIALLAQYFLDLAAAKYARDMSSFSPGAMKLLEAYDWPGNIRQLEYLINQIVITNNSTELTEDMLSAKITEQPDIEPFSNNIQMDKPPDKTIPSIQEMEEQLILKALELTSGSVPDAAKHLGISEVTLYRKIKKFGLTRTFVKPT